jgi:hypothetical protein
VRARHVIVCVDRFAPQLGIARDKVYHQQNFIAVSEPLAESVQEEIFPSGPLLLFDAGFLFHYMRLTPEGRLIVGGSRLREAYRAQECDAGPVAKHLVRWVRQKFPVLEKAEFTHCWRGLFGLTRDLLPIAGKSTRSSADGIYVGLGGGGMTWSVLAGKTAAEIAVRGNSPLASFLSPSRTFTPMEGLPSLLGRGTRFALSHQFARTFLQGDSEDLERQRRKIRAAASAAAIGTAVGVASLWGIYRLLRKAPPEEWLHHPLPQEEVEGDGCGERLNENPAAP